MKAAPAVVGCALLSLLWAAPTHADRRFHAILTGAQQAPPVASSGTGIGTVVLNTAETHITVNLTFSGLTSNATAAARSRPADDASRPRTSSSSAAPSIPSAPGTALRPSPSPIRR